jgi:Mrp family chromosome partitioning ATPase
MLGFTGAGSVPGMIRGERPLGEGLVRIGERLAVGLNSAAEPWSADLLLGRRAPEAIRELRRQFQPDLVLYDLPPMLADDGVLAVAQCLDAVLLTVAAGESRLDQVSACEAELSGSCPLVGVVLNKCWYP